MIRSTHRSIMKQTDIKVDCNLVVAYAARNNKAYNANTDLILRFYRQAIPILHKLLDNSNHPTVRICAIATQNRNGVFSQIKNSIEVDCRLSVKEAMRVLCHEYIHWDQVQKGHLGYKIDNNKVVRLWKDRPVYNKGTTHSAYLNQPWEIDARNREMPLMEQVIQQMKEAK